MTMTLPILTLALSGLLAQIPDPAKNIAIARDAKAKIEAAQKKNAVELDQTPKPAAPAPAPVVPGQPGAAPMVPGQPGAAPIQAEKTGAGYSYDPAGRRDPFVTLTGRGGDLPTEGGGSRPPGIAGVLVSEVTVKGVIKSSKGGFIALVQSPDNHTYLIHPGDKVFDGTVKTITQDAVVFSQDVNDPLSLVKQREVRKTIRPEAR